MKLVSISCLIIFLSVPSFASDSTELAFDLTSYFRASREVVSRNNPLIRDPESFAPGSKFAAAFITKTNRRYIGYTARPFSKEEEIRGYLVEAIREVITDAVNGKYKSILVYNVNDYYREGSKKYDGKFLPARYAVEVMRRFSNKTGGRVVLKLTAPTNLLVKKSNAPDDWESSIIGKLQHKEYERGRSYSETVVRDGVKYFRLILPEYYNKSCLGCHGTVGGPRIHKERIKGKMGQLGGVISVIVKE